MPVIFECEYLGGRYAGLGLPTPGEPLKLYPVADGELRKAVVAGAGAGGLLAVLAEHPATVSVAADDPGLRLLPPLLPEGAAGSLVTGFMSTHRSKHEQEPYPPVEFRPPNWLIKAMGSWLRLPGEPLAVAGSTVALLEEPEVALVYVNDEAGEPHYAGYTFANDLNDIGFHLQNPWGWTPYSKLCDTSMTPWLFLDEPPAVATGRIVIERDGETAWQGPFACGADALYQPVPDMVDHLFSHPGLRRPNLVNYLLLGSDKASYHAGFRIADGDRVTIEVASHGVVLSNPIAWDRRPTPRIEAGRTAQPAAV
jgi:hypothetical protein